MLLKVFQVQILVILFYCCQIPYIEAETNNNAENSKLSPTITIKQGSLQGITLKSRNGQDYYAYYGIPYAKKPKRFQNPELLKEEDFWKGIHNATIPGPKCLQYVFGNISGSEDCLYLNVYTNNLNKENATIVQEIQDLKPVIVYIHGGRFSTGSGDLYGAGYLMDEPVVFVTINYRLSVLGFLNLGRLHLDGDNNNIARGNMGLKDQVMALKWIQENIATFGGDPKRVTLFGASAGGVSVAYHILSPMSKGLFHNAISSSGTALCPWGITRNPEYFAKELANAVDCSTLTSKELIDCLLEKDAEDIIAKSDITSIWPLDPIAPFAPSIEDHINNSQIFLGNEPETLLRKGHFNKVPWIIGITKDEGFLMHAAKILLNPVYLKELNDNWNQIAPATFGYEDIIPNSAWESAAIEIRQFYFGSQNISEETIQNLEDVYSDRNFMHSAYSSIVYHSNFSPVYPYVFEFSDGQSITNTTFNLNVKNIANISTKVIHGDDIRYIFDGLIRVVKLEPNNSEAIQISKTFVKLLVSFASNGKPDGNSILGIDWPETSKEENTGQLPLKWLHISNSNFSTQSLESTGGRKFKERIEFWDNLLNKYN